ncbi:MAG: alpha/beta hydrolase [Proteobacteria bacterium]|nr:alpha/beta hydrolase [Pseudomonadota bacterium]
MRHDIEFSAEGTILRGWLYEPEKRAGRTPIIVMAHGFSAVKEQHLDRYAEVFSAAGFAVLVYDHRCFGASDGEPRQEADPVQQCRDYRHAITFARTLSDIDPDRIGIWGTSFGGGHVLFVAAVDRRVKCVVSQVPLISGLLTTQRRVRPDLLPFALAAFDADRLARFEGKPPAMVPVVAEDPATPCVLPGADAWSFLMGANASPAPNFRNEVTLRSRELLREYEPGHYVRWIGPTPLLMILARDDTLLPPDLAQDAFREALETKRLLILPGGHFDPYVKEFDRSSTAARDWFLEHLT